MQLKPYLSILDGQGRAEFAALCGTSVPMLRQIAGGFKHVELGFADVLVAVSRGVLTLDELPLTPRAREQARIRAAFTKARARARTAATAAAD